MSWPRVLLLAFVLGLVVGLWTRCLAPDAMTLFGQGYNLKESPDGLLGISFTWDLRKRPGAAVDQAVTDENERQQRETPAVPP